jgi:hypothetical protein
MIDGVVKTWELKTPPNDRFDCGGTRTADALGVRAVGADGLTNHFD